VPIEYIEIGIGFREMWKESVGQGPEVIRKFFADYDEGWL